MVVMTAAVGMPVADRGEASPLLGRGTGVEAVAALVRGGR